MLARKIFVMFSACLAVNLNPRKLKVIALIVLFNVTYFVYIFIESVCFKLKHGEFSVFSFIGIIQDDLLYMLQILFLFRGLLKMNLSNRIILKID